ncbi:helix-turn-helix domain-containing protein [Paenibacillus ihuae]|uniref:helix-turn-helix domain-containing protein n=1 Tax=Paenibacillus ihuae TaxID=1232431 RepID=UPI0006D5B66C|nr:helix-turn-helix transcriptional regulator [Paenibacillus ihuae]
MSNLMDIIGVRIRSLRKEKGWSQEELAERAGLHFTYIGKIERSEHKVTIESLEKVTRALGISLEEFFHLIQPIREGTFNDTLTKILNSLLNRSIDDQKKALHLIEFVLNWKDE